MHRATAAVVMCCAAGSAACSTNPACAQDDSSPPTIRFEDITEHVGLGPEIVGHTIARCLFVDLNQDGRPDVVLHSPQPPASRAGEEHAGNVRFPRVFLHTLDPDAPLGFRYVEVDPSNLPVLYPGDGLVFADMNNNGLRDAIITRNVDWQNDAWNEHGERTAIAPGRGDGTFGTAERLDIVEPATTAAIAIGDITRNGRLDLFLGNWYTRYGQSLEGYHNQLVYQLGNGTFTGDMVPQTDAIFDPENDLAGRPTYGVMIATLGLHDDPDREPALIELNYGRRWNRLFQRSPRNDNPYDILWQDLAPELGFDGDAIRHGRHPEWLRERARTDPRFDRQDEPAFRANGNTFDIAVGDIDNNGRWDFFIAEITHGWAGDSSDRSRFLINNGQRGGALRFEEDPRRSVDRIPEGVDNWNHGDLFCELVDLDHDGRLDLLLSSGDYPDDQRLRVYLQQPDGTFRDATAESGLDHDGSQMISLADVTGDGAIEILVGQTFNRFTPEQREGRQPQLRLFRIHHAEPAAQRSLTLRLTGDTAAGTNRDALGAVVRIRTGETTMQRQLIGIGGHAGKQHDLLIHFGLGPNERIDEVTIIWPNAEQTIQSFTDITPGRYELTQGGALRPAR